MREDFADAAFKGDFVVLEKCRRRKEFVSDNALDYAAGEGQLDVLKWFKRYYPSLVPTSHTLGSALFNGHLYIANWLVKNYPDLVPNPHCVTCAARHHQSLEWLFKRYPNTQTDIFSWSVVCEFGNLKCMELMWKTHPSTRPRPSVITEAAERGHLHVLIWCVERFKKIRSNHYALDAADNKGHYDYYFYLIATGIRGIMRVAFDIELLILMDNLFVLNDQVPLCEPKMNSVNLVRKCHFMHPKSSKKTKR